VHRHSHLLIIHSTLRMEISKANYAVREVIFTSCVLGSCCTW
jgi:hypothetical protein